MTTDLHIERIKAEKLTEPQRELWSEMHRHNPALYSPYFHPDYTQLISQLQNDVYIALISQADKLVGFLPFQQRRKNASARPVGAPMTDYHGIISRAETKINVEDILKTAQISAFHMPSQMNSQTSEDGLDISDCCVMRLVDFESPQAWRDSRDSSYRRHLKSTRRRIKKTESEHGERSFIWQSQDQSHFDLLVQWKKEKFSDTGKYDVLSVDWTLGLLKTLWERGPKAGLRCDLHVMMVSGKPAAMDLGLTDGTTFHSWIVGYDNALHTLSPGMQLLETLIDQAPEIGYENIDLGAGLGGYKKHYASWPHTAISQTYTGAGLSAKQAQLYGKLETFGQDKLKDIPGKLRRRYSQISACDSSFSGQARAMLKAIKNGG